jgi:transcriptional regulator GlxA family with amidase domain
MALDGCMLSSLSGPADALRVAQTLAEIRSPNDAPKFESIVFSARNAKRVRSESGIEIGDIKPLGRDQHFDLVLVPGINHHRPGE